MLVKITYAYDHKTCVSSVKAELTECTPAQVESCLPDLLKEKLSFSVTPASEDEVEALKEKAIQACHCFYVNLVGDGWKKVSIPNNGVYQPISFFTNQNAYGDEVKVDVAVLKKAPPRQWGC